MEDFRVIIAGSRGFNNYNYLCERMDFLLKEKIKTHKIVIISGTATGADKTGEHYAKEREFECIQCPAEWDLHGKSAGYRRNEEMGIISDVAAIFWDGKSRGSRHMSDIMNKLNKPCKVYVVHENNL